MGRIKFTDYVPLNLVGVNSPSRTLVSEVVTGTPISTGAVPGESFFISKQQAAQLSTPYYPCYPGWYRVVLVDVGATAANIAFGTIGGQLSIGASTLLDAQVTDASHVLNLGIAPCVFLTGGLGLIVSSAYVPALAAMTPGNYTIVQDAGDASLLVAANQTVSVGSVLVSTATGQVAVAGSISDTVYSTIVGIAEAALTVPAAFTGTAVAAASGGVAVYTGTYTGGGSNAFAGFQVVTTGTQFTANAVTSLITASSATTLTVANPNAVAETHAHTATLQGLVRARLGFPFGQQI
jgi:hypothetical protein